MRTRDCRGSSLIETIVALGLTSSVCAGLLPALALVSRLHRESSVHTESAVAASARLERLADGVSAGLTGAGGGLDAAVPGWHEFIDRAGDPAAPERAAFESRWQVAAVAYPPAIHVVSVRVIPLGRPGAAVTLSLVIPDG